MRHRRYTAGIGSARHQGFRGRVLRRFRRSLTLRDFGLLFRAWAHQFLAHSGHKRRVHVAHARTVAGHLRRLWGVSPALHSVQCRHRGHALLRRSAWVGHHSHQHVWRLLLLHWIERHYEALANIPSPRFGSLP
jgi:hypothetical protein